MVTIVIETRRKLSNKNVAHNAEQFSYQLDSVFIPGVQSIVMVEWREGGDKLGQKYQAYPYNFSLLEITLQEIFFLTWI